MVSDEAGRQPKSLLPSDGAGAGDQRWVSAKSLTVDFATQDLQLRVGLQRLLPQDLAPIAAIGTAWPP